MGPATQEQGSRVPLDFWGMTVDSVPSNMGWFYYHYCFDLEPRAHSLLVTLSAFFGPVLTWTANSPGVSGYNRRSRQWIPTAFQLTTPGDAAARWPAIRVGGDGQNATASDPSAHSVSSVAKTASTRSRKIFHRLREWRAEEKVIM